MNAENINILAYKEIDTLVSKRLALCQLLSVSCKKLNKNGIYRHI